MASVALVIPVLNEVEQVESAISHWQTLGLDGIVVVDGGSKDGTLERLQQEKSIRCVTSTPGRPTQLNVGAQAAKADILLFGHIDMKFPQEAIPSIKEAIASGAVGGGFFKRHMPGTALMRIYGWGLNYILLNGLHEMVGTNGIFATREAFEKAGQFPELPLLEDLVFSENLARQGRLAILPQYIEVSDRRYRQKGRLKQMGINGRILFEYKVLGRDLEQLKTLYQRLN